MQHGHDSFGALRRLQQFAFVIVGSCACLAASSQRVITDNDFDVSVRSPAYTREHPRVVIDEAHHNLHTMEGRYKPFARLLSNDGYQVEPGMTPFEASAFRGVTVLVVSNALNGDGPPSAGKPAFTSSECDAVQQWVRNGGSLLLIADHKPFGAAAYELAMRFGVEMGKGYVFDPTDSMGNPTFLVFSRENGLLGDHAVTEGRNQAEQIDRLVAFTGQALSIPSGGTAFMKLGPSAYEVDSPEVGYTIAHATAGGQGLSKAHGGARSVAGRAQGVALEYGRGRVIVVGEAAMFSAQILKLDEPGESDVRFGMNVAGNQDKQLALNVIHWLSRAIP
ncbi:MAG TPA: DUF4350 domain-containing protein [Steroidobacteraceae bacterium]|nr:DUF4350 domain-containing protein [Steroidobacteraceae bacterium]